MIPHRHAEVLRAIADGVPLHDFEVQAISWANDDDSWVLMDEDGTYTAWITSPDRWQIRRKPQHIMVNGFKVPKPLDSSTAPNSLGTVFWPFLTYESLWDSAVSAKNSESMLAIQRGCAHSTREAAIAHAKAMLGIDPVYF